MDRAPRINHANALLNRALDGGGRRRLDAALERAAFQPGMRWSNFLITVSTNVIPESNLERIAITNWFHDTLGDRFSDFDSLNGHVIKPAGADNGDNARFEAGHQITGIKVRITVEEGAVRGQMHAHVLMEICHSYTEPHEHYHGTGVHINVRSLREVLNAQIPNMPIAAGRRPASLYINSRLLTRQGDVSSKYLTLSYIRKDVDVHGRDLAADRAHAAGTRDGEISDRFRDHDHVYRDLLF